MHGQKLAGVLLHLIFSQEASLLASLIVLEKYSNLQNSGPVLSRGVCGASVLVLQDQKYIFKANLSVIFIYCASTKSITEWFHRECNGYPLSYGIKPKCAPTLPFPLLSSIVPESNMENETCTRWQDALPNCVPPLINLSNARHLDWHKKPRILLVARQMSQLKQKKLGEDFFFLSKKLIVLTTP